MKWLRFGLLVVAVTSAAAAAAFAYRGWTAQPQGLVAEPATVVHRGLGQREQVESSVQLVNKHDATIRIVAIVKSCGCLVADPDQKELRSGERTRLKMVWYTGSARGPTTVRVSVYYELPDGKKHLISIRVEGDIEPDVIVAPTEMKFSAKEAAARLVRFSPGRVTEFALGTVSCSHKAFTARVVPGGSEVEVTFDPNQWPRDEQRISAYLLVETSRTVEPLIYVPLLVEE